MLNVLIAAVALFLLAGIGFRLLEGKLIYYPRPLRQGALEDHVALLDPEGESWEEVEFTASDGIRLTGWLGVPSSPRAWLLWLHGNAGNISHRFDDLAFFVRRANLAVLIFDYRGYGSSEGGPSEEGLYLDSRAACEYLRGRGVPPEQLFLLGRSLGGAVAVELAEARPVRGLILESTFTSIRAMAHEVVPFFPTHWFAKSRYATDERIGKLTVPVLHFHGTADRLVPFEHGRRLAELANREAHRFVPVEGAGHEDVGALLGPRYLRMVTEFIDGCLDD